MREDECGSGAAEREAERVEGVGARFRRCEVDGVGKRAGGQGGAYGGDARG